MMPNKIGRANRRSTSPFNAGRQFESASCAPPFLSAAVAHLRRSDTPVSASFYTLSGRGLSYFSSMIQGAISSLMSPSRFSASVDAGSAVDVIANPPDFDSRAAESGSARTWRFSELAGPPQLGGPFRFSASVLLAASH